MSLYQWAALVIFACCFLLFTFERISKTIISLLGGILFILLRFTSEESAFSEHVDWNVLLLLIGMMLLVGITQKTGLFQFLAIKAAKLARGNPHLIMLLLSLLTAVCSALLDNVTTIIILTPVSMVIAVELAISPIPFVLTNAIAANIGGTATLIGDPPNIMIGSAANLSFQDFLVNLGPPALLSYLGGIGLLMLYFRSQMQVSDVRRQRIMNFDANQALQNPVLLIKCLVVLSLVVIGFLLHGFLHLEPSSIALFAAALLMLIAGTKDVEEYFAEVEWGTIFFFLGLFIMVGGLVDLGIIAMMSENLLTVVGSDGAGLFSLVLWMSGILSGLIDNIPYVATMIPLIENLDGNPDLWWALALGSCFGGNATLIGASANVLSVNIAKKGGYEITFFSFLKTGAMVTVVSLIIANIYILIRY